MDDNTIMFTQHNKPLEIKDILFYVKNSLEEKGYNYQNQIVGYLLSGDPSYIPRYNNARNLIKSVDRDAIIEVLLEDFLKNNE